MNLQMVACPWILAPNDRMGSEWSCRISWRVTLATMVFSSLTASFLIEARTWSSVRFVKLPPAALVRSLRRSSSQHSCNWRMMSLPVMLVASL